MFQVFTNSHEALIGGYFNDMKESNVFRFCSHYPLCFLTIWSHCKDNSESSRWKFTTLDYPKWDTKKRLVFSKILDSISRLDSLFILIINPAELYPQVLVDISSFRAPWFHYITLHRASIRTTNLFSRVFYSKLAGNPSFRSFLVCMCWLHCLRRRQLSEYLESTEKLNRFDGHDLENNTSINLACATEAH
jgi:hypothetical protein